MRYKFQQQHKFKTKRKDKFRLLKLVDLGKKFIAFTILGAVGVLVYPWEIQEAVINFKNEIPSYFGIAISDINIEGLEKVSPEDIAHIIKFNVGDNLYQVDLDKVRQELEEYPWIATATVERVLPSSINISIQEERPKAVYIKGNERFYVNDDGKIIEKINNVSEGNGYMYVMGEEANAGYSDILDQVYEVENIYQCVEGMIKSRQKRWDLKLKNNIILKLPQDDVVEALTQFSRVIDDNLNYFKNGAIIDLRFMPEKMYIK